MKTSVAKVLSNIQAERGKKKQNTVVAGNADAAAAGLLASRRRGEENSKSLTFLTCAMPDEGWNRTRD